MKKLWIMMLMLTACSMTAKAAELGDIMYHDGTFEDKYNADKIPIGVVFFVYKGGENGLVVSITQPATMNRQAAQDFCKSFYTMGTSAGKWHLASLYELEKFSDMVHQGVEKKQYTYINSRLGLLPLANKLTSENYILDTTNSTPFLINPANGGITTGSATSLYRPRCIMAF